MVHFSMPNSIAISGLYILTVWMSISSSFSFLQIILYNQYYYILCLFHIVWGQVDLLLSWIEYFFFYFSCVFPTCIIQSFVASKYFLSPILLFDIHLHSFNFTLWSAGTAKSTIQQVLSFLLIIIRCGHLAEIRWSVCMSKPQRILYISFSRTDSELYT